MSGEELTSLPEKTGIRKDVRQVGIESTEVPLRDAQASLDKWLATLMSSGAVPARSDYSLARGDSLSQGRASFDRTYPQYSEPNSDFGLLRQDIERARSDVRLALEEFDGGDIGAMASNLSLAASVLSKSLHLADFNDALGSILAFAKRAMLLTQASEVSRGMLNVLLTTLGQLLDGALLDLDGAAEFADSLAAQGWRGEEVETAKFVAEMISGYQVDDQIDLFAEKGRA